MLILKMPWGGARPPVGVSITGERTMEPVSTCVKALGNLCE